MHGNINMIKMKKRKGKKKMNAGGINSNKGVQELKRKSRTGLTAGALGFKGFNQGRMIEIRQPRFDQGTSKHG